MWVLTCSGSKSESNYWYYSYVFAYFTINIYFDFFLLYAFTTIPCFHRSASLKQLIFRAEMGLMGKRLGMFRKEQSGEMKGVWVFQIWIWISSILLTKWSWKRFTIFLIFRFFTCKMAIIIYFAILLSFNKRLKSLLRRHPLY